MNDTRYDVIQQKRAEVRMCRNQFEQARQDGRLAHAVAHARKVVRAEAALHSFIYGYDERQPS